MTRRQLGTAVIFKTPTVILVVSSGRTSPTLGTAVERITLTVERSLLALVVLQRNPRHGKRLGPEGPGTHVDSSPVTVLESDVRAVERTGSGTPTPTPRTAGRRPRAAFGFRPEIEGLRAIAVLGVVLYHAGVGVIPGGFIGVDIFFVLSGYLITGLMLSEVADTGRLSLRDFYARRIRRLLPAAVLVLVVTAAASAVMLPMTQRATAAADIRAAGLYVSNWRFAAQSVNYSADTSSPSPVLHFWSLGVEEQFYILWPVLIVSCLFALRWYRRTREGVDTTASAEQFGSTRLVLGVVISLVAVLSFLWCVRLTEDDQSLAFFNTFTRIWELALGAVVAVVGRRVLAMPHAARGALAWAGLLAIAWCLLTYSESMEFPGWVALVPVLGTVLIVVGCTGRTSTTAPGPARLLSVAPMRHVGRISYSWYLWHWPLIVLPAAYVGHGLNRPQLALAVLASYGLAVASTKLVETPVRFAPALRAARPAMILGLCLTVVTIAASVGLVRSASRGVELTGRVDQTTEVSDHVYLAAPDVTVNMTTGEVSTPPVLTPSALEASDDYGALYDQDCQAHLLDVAVKDCPLGDLNATKTVVVFGDSHASAWTPGLEIVAMERGWKLIPMSKGRCGVGTYMPFDDQLKREYRECETWRQAALAKMRQISPDMIIMASRWHSVVAGPNGERIAGNASRPAVAQGTAAMAEELQQISPHVVYMRDWAAPGSVVPTCISKHLKNPEQCDFDRADHAPDDRALMAALAAVPGLTVVDLTKLICPPDQAMCPVTADNIIRYRDDSHISATFSRTLAPALIKKLPAQI